MSSNDYKSTRLSREQARKLIAKITKEDNFGLVIKKHALEEMENDDLSTPDIINILKSPSSRIIKEGEYKPKYNAYTYQYGTLKIIVVIQFWPDGRGLTVVTAWRIRKG